MEIIIGREENNFYIVLVDPEENEIIDNYENLTFDAMQTKLKEFRQKLNS